MLNLVTIQGRLTKEPELRRTQNGTAVASFTLACDRDYTNDRGDRECDFILVNAWRGTAEFVAKWFRKGDQALVTGRIQVRSYTDKDGNKRQATEIVADKIHFCGSKTDREEQDYARAEKAGKQMSDGKPVNVAMDEDEDGELPF